jgi:Phosphotransferase enzyme family
MKRQVVVPDDHGSLLRDLAALAEKNAKTWFPGLDAGPVSVSLVSLNVRPRCFLYRFALTQNSARRQIVAKVRHSDPQHRRADRYPDRPELTPQRTMSDREAAHLEYVGLNLIATALDGSDPQRFGVLRALDELPDRATVVMEFVDQPTLRELLSRPAMRSSSNRSGPPGDAVWTALGDWLRRFHTAHPGESLPGRMTHVDELAGQLDRSLHFLGRVGADRSTVGGLARSATRRLRETWLSESPCAVAHGDFTSQNVFVSPEGRITVFDPLPVWRVCVFEDLARLTMGLRLLGPQALTRGRLFNAPQLRRWEANLLEAYAGHGAPPDPLYIYQAILLLDRWGELLSKHPARGRARRGIRRVRVSLASGWFEHEARRLTSLLD